MGTSYAEAEAVAIALPPRPRRAVAGWLAAPVLVPSSSSLSLSRTRPLSRWYLPSSLPSQRAVALTAFGDKIPIYKAAQEGQFCWNKGLDGQSRQNGCKLREGEKAIRSFSMCGMRKEKAILRLGPQRRRLDVRSSAPRSSKNVSSFLLELQSVFRPSSSHL